MIDHKYKCIYIHVLKTGGTSIVNEFYPEYWNRQNIKLDPHFLGGGVNHNPEDYDLYQEKYKDYFVFSSVRNPWDRFVSGWKYCNNLSNVSFNELLNSLPQFNSSFGYRHKNNHDYSHVTKTQSQFIYKDNQLIPQLLIRYENLQEDFDKLCDIIGKPKSILKHYKKSKRESYKEYFKEQKHLDTFEKYFKEDIINFNYQF